MNKFSEMLERLKDVHKTLWEIRDDQDMHCGEDGACKYCRYRISLDDVIPIEENTRVCLFHLQDTALIEIRKRLKALKEANSSCEELLK
jgi:hypothetical protein